MSKLDEADKKLKATIAKAKETAKEIEPKLCGKHGKDLNSDCDECARYVGEYLSHSYLTTNIEQVEKDNDMLNHFLDFVKSGSKPPDSLDEFISFCGKKERK